MPATAQLPADRQAAFDAALADLAAAAELQRELTLAALDQLTATRVEAA